MINPHEMPKPSKDQPILRVRALAADLAFGALKGYWTAEIPETATSQLKDFLVKIWNNDYPNYGLLESFGYMNGSLRYGSLYYKLTQKAFDLLEEIPPKTKVFISYSRKNSSAFALAIHYKLLNLNVESFLDKEIDLGDEWHARLKARIQNCDYFIPILAPKTLESDIVRKEIQWAQEANRACIPVTHLSFNFELHLNPRKEISNHVKKYLNSKNACLVDGIERAAIYHEAINKITNQLGFSE